MTREPAPQSQPATVGRWRDLVPQPWRNGGGVVRELARGLDTGHDPAWRVSIADITSAGDFSTFEDTERALTVVEGTRLVLEVQGEVRALGQTEPFRFDGAAATRADLPDGPVRVLNLFTAKGTCHGDITLQHASVGHLLDPGGDSLVVVSLDDTDVAVSLGGAEHRLGRFDWLVLPPTMSALVLATARLACVRITDAGDSR